MLSCPVYSSTVIEVKEMSVINWQKGYMHKDNIKVLLLLSQLISYLGKNIDLVSTVRYWTEELFSEKYTQL